MPDDVQHLGADFGDYFEGVEKLNSENAEAQAHFESLLDSIKQYGQGLDDSVIKISKVSSSGNKFTASIQKIDDTFQLVSKSVSVAIEKVEEFLTLEEEQAKLSAELSSVRAVSDDRAAQARAAFEEEQRVKSVLAEQADQFERLKAEANAFNQIEKEAEAILNRQQKVLNKIASEIERGNQAADKEAEASLKNQLKILEQISAEIEKGQQLETAKAFGAGLTKQFVTQAPGGTTATAPDVNKVASAVAQIQTLIAQEAISVQRAEEVIASTFARTGEVFTGTEARVAAAAIKIQQSSDALATSQVRNQNKIEASNKLLQDSFNRVGDEGDKAGKGILISWQSMGRILFTQQLHLAVYKLVDAFRAGIGAAQDFEIKISEIRTLATQNQLSFDTWATSVEQLSNKFGTPVLDVAQAAYETLSNQVAKGADTFQFLDKVLQFSQVTQSTAADSANLLASAINGFQISASQSERISSVFFNTIDLGRIKASELANTFGRVAPLAHAVGVSFEETNAALATLTINGVPANEAMTLVNNVLTHLVNPTKEMKELFKQLGVTSGEAAIATFGFAGFMEKLDQATQGTSGEMAKLFSDIRAERGAIGLTGSALEGFKRNLDAISNTEPFDLSKKIIIESAGKQFQIQLNEIKNFFINDFGRSIIAGAVGISDSLKSLGIITTGYVDLIKELIALIGTATIAFVGYKVVAAGIAAVETANALAAFSNATALGILGASAESAAFSLGILGKAGSGLFTILSTPAGIAAAAIAAIAFEMIRASQASSELTSRLESFDQTVKSLSEETINNFNASQQKMVNSLEQSLDKQFKAYLDNSRKINQTITALEDEAKHSFERIAEDVKSSFESAIKGTQDGITRLQNQIRTAQSEIDNSQRTIEETLEGLKKSQFDAKIKLLPDTDQIDQIFKHINDESEKSTKLLTNKFTDSGVGEKNRNEATKLTNQAQQELVGLAEREERAKENIKNLEEQIARIKGHQSNVGDIRDSQRQLVALRQLEAAHADSVRKHNTVQAQQIRANIDLLKAQITEQRQSDQDETSDAQLQVLQEKLDKNKAIVAAVESHGGVLQETNKVQQNLVTGLSKYQEIQTKIRDDSQKQLTADQQHLIDLRNTLEAINKVKVPTDIKSPDQAKKFIAENFDAPIQKAIESGAIRSDAVLQNVLKERAALENDLNLQVIAKRQQASEAAFIKERDSIKSNIDLQQKAINDATANRTNAISGINLAIAPQKNGQSGLISQFLDAHGFGGSERTAFDEKLDKLVDTFTKFQGGTASFKTVQLQAGQLQQAIADTGLGFSGDKQFNDIFNDLQVSLAKLANSQQQITAAQGQQAQGNAALKTLGVSPLDPQTLTNSVQTVTKSYLDSIDSSIDHVKILNQSMSDLSQTISTLPTPRFQNVVAGGALPSTSATQAVTFNLNITTNQPINAQTLQASINEAVRKGQLKIPQAVR